MLYLSPPRHTSTLPKGRHCHRRAEGPLWVDCGLSAIDLRTAAVGGERSFAATHRSDGVALILLKKSLGRIRE